MKNLLILLTVLATASVANAALKISVDGVVDAPTVELFASDVVTIDVAGDGQTAAPLAAWLISEGPGALAGGDMLYPGTLSSIYTYMPGSGDGYEEIRAWLESEGYVDVMGVSYVEFADGSSVQPPLDGKLADGIAYHQGDIGEVLLSLVSADLTLVYDTQVIMEVPEPITFALLGLGGLFLRRRR